jgi:hypothetical protein
MKRSVRKIQVPPEIPASLLRKVRKAVKELKQEKIHLRKAL